ncbi:hypothetical protein TRFO_07045 [Tritrichomonas foetus]|uniref:Transmembrane adaptor Erv26 n=1 Tax=Tritrichomonas foetus TaxID=1144522 RepID=A0A1J4JU08_9EUKA|nr:hypothetical protein TRFO_07045 [Tritrichomonas foetus]|eukprot:OHT02623.1 hypothetical protein TRFO_07045 [Tritrichomonas foetus]
MSNFVASFIFWAEIVVAFLLLVGVFFALIFLSLSFVEERVRFITRFAQVLNALVIGLTFIIPFSNYGIIPFLTTLTANILWFVVLSRGFPFINLLSFDLIGGFICSIISHFAWIFGFLNTEVSGHIALFCYLLMVWAIPLLIVITMPSIFDDNGQQATGENSRRQQKSIWSDLIPRWIEKVKGLMPHTGSKLD